MRIRSTKPEFWRSKTIAELEWADRFVLKGLEAYVDDNGVGKDDVELIASDVFPRDLARDPETLARLAGAITRVSAAGLVIRYETNGEHLLYIDKWKDIQRIDKPGRGRFPRPDGSLEYADAVDRASYAKPRETVAPGTGEQGNRGTGEQGTTTREFDEPPAPEPPETEYDVVVDDVPEFIDNPSKPAKRHASSASKTVVRQELGNAGYPRTTIDRLAVQVEKLFREGHPDALIREALGEWDKRENALPEWLATILSDIVKRSRATPGNNGKPVHKLRQGVTLAQRVRAEEDEQAQAEALAYAPSNRRELM